METNFKFVNICINDIETSDERFKITSNKSSLDLEQSIREIGVLNPPLLLHHGKRYIIISGFRRIEALKNCGIETLGARVTESDSKHVCSRIAVSDNSFQRTLNVAEQIKSIRLLAGFYSEHESSQDFHQEACTALRIPQNKTYILKLWRASNFSDELLDLIEQERISIDVALEVSEFSSEIQKRISLLLSDYKISLSKQKELILFIREISAREKCSIGHIFDDIMATLDQWQHISDMNARFGKLRAYLKKRRYPEMTSVLDKHETLVASLSIPAGMKFAFPDYLEGSSFSINLTFKTKRELDKLSFMLDQICSKPEMEMILNREYNFK